MSIGRVPGDTGIQPTIVDAKGDLIVATAADSVSRLAVGANDTVLTADSAQSTGVKWAAIPAYSYTWTDYTPDFKQSTTTISKTINWARYLVINKLVIVSVNMEATSTGVSSGRIFISWPSGYTPKYVQSNGLYPMYGVGHWYDASQNINHMAHITEDGGIFVLKATQSDINNFLAATVNTSAIASGDRVGFTIMYEVA